ncbi:hypothetical protein E4U33_001899, partial [Claviceps sp. LM78 group G4]
MSSTTKATTRASTSRSASQPAVHQQPQAPQVGEDHHQLDLAPINLNLFLQSLANQVQTMATQVESLTKCFHSVRTETDDLRHSVREQSDDLRKVVLSKQSNVTAITNVGTSSHFTKPERFSGKDLTTFRAWWASVTFYLEANTESLGTDTIKINWVASHLTGKALTWHLDRQREFGAIVSDSWASYSKALKERFTDKGEDAKNYHRMMQLKYDGDTNDYLTQFTELNTSGQPLGFHERSTIRKALPYKIVDRMQTWKQGKSLTDAEFISAQMSLGGHQSRIPG